MPKNYIAELQELNQFLYENRKFFFSPPGKTLLILVNIFGYDILKKDDSANQEIFIKKKFNKVILGLIKEYLNCDFKIILSTTVQKYKDKHPQTKCSQLFKDSTFENSVKQLYEAIERENPTVFVRRLLTQKGNYEKNSIKALFLQIWFGNDVFPVLMDTIFLYGLGKLWNDFVKEEIYSNILEYLGNFILKKLNPENENNAANIPICLVESASAPLPLDAEVDAFSLEMCRLSELRIT